MLISADDEFIRIAFCNLVTNPSMDVPSALVGRSTIQIQSSRTACYWPVFGLGLGLDQNLSTGGAELAHTPTMQQIVISRAE